MNYSGKKVVITGGAGGIGYEVCQQLLNQGVNSLAIMELMDPLNKIEKLIKKYTTKTILFIKTDVTNKEEVADAFRQIIEQFKTIDLFIGNAAILDETKVELTMAVNFLGVFYTTMKAIEIMSIENGNGKGGIIVTLASVAALAPFYSTPVYTASKHAVLGFIRALSNEYYHQKYGITFITICPGVTDTTIISDMEKKVIDPDTGPETVRQFNLMHLNTPIEMGKFISDIIKTGENGSVWIADKTIRTVNIINYWP